MPRLFRTLYDYAVQHIKKERLTFATLAPKKSANIVDLTEPGKNSPYRDRSVEENLDCLNFAQWRIPRRFRTLRAKIDLASVT
jgi:glutaminyl-tRNA synthetase